MGVWLLLTLNGLTRLVATQQAIESSMHVQMQDAAAVITKQQEQIQQMDEIIQQQQVNAQTALQLHASTIDVANI